VDATSNSVTLTERDGSTATFTLDKGAKVFVHSAGTPVDIKATDRVRVISATDIIDGATAVTASTIIIVPESQPAEKNAGTGYRAKRVDGDVVTLSPLTIKTPGGVTVAVTTTDTTPVQKDSPGGFSDIAVGTRVAAIVTGDAPSFVAKVVRVMPAEKKHGHHAAAPAPAQ
jgi:hypothetical protein